MDFATLRVHQPNILGANQNPPGITYDYVVEWAPGVDPDDELITNVSVTAANTPDRQGIDELLDEPGADTEPATDEPADDTDTDTGPDGGAAPKDFEVYGDSAYADGATLHEQTQRGHDMRTKVPPVRNANGFSKDQFRIDLAAAPSPARHSTQ